MWKPLIVCDGTKADPCNFAKLVELVNALITDLVIISTLIAVAAFAYAGLLLMTSGGSEGKKDRAKKMLWKVLMGYLWILGAWIVVYTITGVLLHDGYSILESIN